MEYHLIKKQDEVDSEGYKQSKEPQVVEIPGQAVLKRKGQADVEEPRAGRRASLSDTERCALSTGLQRRLCFVSIPLGQHRHELSEGYQKCWLFTNGLRECLKETHVGPCPSEPDLSTWHQQRVKQSPCLYVVQPECGPEVLFLSELQLETFFTHFSECILFLTATFPTKLSTWGVEVGWQGKPAAAGECSALHRGLTAGAS